MKAMDITTFKNIGLTENKVTLAVAGKFHAFHLASEYASMQKLSALYASHRTINPPKNLTSKQYRNRMDLALAVYISSRLPIFNMTPTKKDEIFDSWVVKNLKGKEPGILHSWNGNSYNTFNSLKGAGWLKCVERSCPFNMFQHELLREEADFLNVEYVKDTSLLAREIEELYLADVIVAPSKYSASTYKDPELIKKVKVNPLGANIKFRERKSRKPSFIVLMVGNYFLRKGTHYLIEAFKLIDRADAELWIRGDVPENYIKRIQDKRIKIIPPLLPEKLNELYQSADIFVQPSIDEGFGMTVFEALAFGLPLVVTENVGAKDLLNSQVSITVPIRNSEELAIAIQKASEMPSKAFDEARKNLLQSVSWSGCAERMFETVYVR
jgi:glycosyltransferase involved in cell wall biosynthesis